MLGIKNAAILYRSVSIFTPPLINAPPSVKISAERLIIVSVCHSYFNFAALAKCSVDNIINRC